MAIILSINRNQLPNVLSQVIELQAKLALEPTQFSALLDTLPVAVLFSLDRECRQIDGNTAARVLLRQLPGQNLSRSADLRELPPFEVYADGKLVPPGELPMQKAAKTGRPVPRSDCEVRFPDGSSIFLAGHSVPILDKAGEVCGSIGAFVDLSEIKRLESENRVLVARLEQRTRSPNSPPQTDESISPVTARPTFFNPLSIRAVLALIIAAAVLPLTIAMLWALFTLTSLAGARQRADLLYSAKSISSAVDAGLGKYITLAEGLGRSPALREGNLSEFQREATQLMPASGTAWVVVSDVDGQQLLNTRVTDGSPLPKRLPQTLNYQRRALKLGRTVVSDVVIEAVFGEPLVDIDVPIFRDGNALRVLTISILASSFNSLLHPTDTPENWLLGVMDAEGRYIARAPDFEGLIGELASPGWRKTAGQDGIFEFVSRDGDTVINVNRRLERTGWTVGVGIKKQEFESAGERTLLFGLMAIGFSLLLSLLIAAALSRRVADAIVRLRDNAAALLSGQNPASLELSKLPELQETWEGLCEAVKARDGQERLLHEKTQQLESLIESAPIGIAYFDRGLRYVHINSELAHSNGVAVGDHIGRTLQELLPRNAEIVGPILEGVFAKGEVVRNIEIEGETPLSPGLTRYWLCGFFPVRDTLGRVDLVGAWIVDITDRKRAEDANRLLMREVNHRSKNLLTVVQAIARQTAREPDPKAFVTRFSLRLGSLAANQDLLVRNEWTGIDLSELVQTQLAPFTELMDFQITYSGDKVSVGPNASQAFGLALHELATNAVKYGALSTPEGRVDVNWRVEESDFVIQWVERGGPAVAPPARRGFGSTVISSMIETALQGAASVDFASGGLVWQLRCPLANLASE